MGMWVIKISSSNKIRAVRIAEGRSCSHIIRVTVAIVLAFITYFRAFFLPRHRLGLEAAALRQQLTVLQRKQPRPRLQIGRAHV